MHMSMKANERIDLAALLQGVDLATLAGVPLFGGAEKYGECPMCGGRDRFHVRRYQGRDWFFCRQCHPGRGDAIEFLRWRDELTTGDAIRTLANLPLAPVVKSVKSGEAAQRDDLPPDAKWQSRALRFIEATEAYLWGEHGAASLHYLRHERGLTDTTIRSARLGLHPGQTWRTWPGEEWGLNRPAKAAPGITIPHLVLGDVWAVNIRQMTATAKARYAKVTGSKRGLYGLNDVRRGCVVLMCAGEFDCLLASQHAPEGLACVTFGSETNGLPARWQIALQAASRVIVAYDNDASGDAGYEQIRAVLQRAKRARVPAGKDITAFWQQGGDVAHWLREVIAGAPDMSTETHEVDTQVLPDDELELLILEWLTGKGYQPRYSSDGGIISAREAVGTR